jgi:hypothetical protein
MVDPGPTSPECTSSTWYHILGYPWVARTLSECSSLQEWWGIIQPLQSQSYVGLPDFINPTCGQYIIKSSFKGPLRTVLNRHRQGLSPWSLEYPHPSPRPSQPMILHFPLVALPGLKFKHQHSIHNFNHFNSIKVKWGPTCEWNQPHIFYY